MIWLFRKYWLIILGCALAAMICSVGPAAASAISEVRIAPDLRRVVIKASGDMGACNAFALDRPPRLVVDITGVSPGKGINIPPPEGSGGLKIQLAESRSGTHVVLEFGGGPVPAHKIKRMGDYLILFLGEWRAPPKPGGGISSTEPQQPRSLFPPTIAAKKGHPVSAPSRLSEIKIESADVVDGLIVLKVSDRTNPDRRFQINLGLNLERLGFVSAGIYPVHTPQGGTPDLAIPQARKTGPRKAVEAPPLENAERIRARGPSEGYRSLEAGANRSRGPAKAVGQRRAPGPVSVRDRAADKPRRAHNFPHVSVVDQARSQLAAYRNSLAAPLATRCGFSAALDGINDYYSALAACSTQ